MNICVSQEFVQNWFEREIVKNYLKIRTGFCPSKNKQNFKEVNDQKEHFHRSVCPQLIFFAIWGIWISDLTKNDEFLFYKRLTYEREGTKQKPDEDDEKWAPPPTWFVDLAG